MRDEAFEALADGTLLLTVLLVASMLVLAFGQGSTRMDRTASIAYADATCTALFQTTIDGLAYRAGGDLLAVRNGTTVESFLRLEVRLAQDGGRAFDFSAANAKVADLAARLIRPGWGIAIRGHLVGGSDLVRIPDAPLAEDYVASAWTYPPLEGAGADTVLAVVVWLNPHR